MKFLNGPAKGYLSLVRLAPEYLRVVVERVSGQIDVLDLPDDEPRAEEAVYVYVRIGEASPLIVDFDIEKGQSGRYTDGDYAHLIAVDGEALRNNAAWRAWVSTRDLSTDRVQSYHDIYE